MSAAAWCLIVPIAEAKPDSTVHVNTIVENTQKLLENYPIEKVHLHFDKPYYSVGDTVWFKGYLTTNLYNYDVSKIMYIEVLTSGDSLVQTLKMPLVNQAGKGQLILDQEWFTQDNYRFRAYTKWMANFDQDYFFNKVVPVGDVLNNILHTNIEFEDISTSRSGRVRARIQFTDRAGNVHANKRVNWEAVSNFEVLDKGRGETDAMGNITVEIDAKDREKFQQGTLNVSVQESRGSDLLVGDFPLRAALWGVDVQFFPEGGDLIAEVAKKTAFKVVGSDGLGLSVQGELLDQQGEVITTFEDLNAGMGYFTFVPQAGHQYRARLTFPNGQTRTVDLPEVKSEGIGLVLTNVSEEAIRIAIVANARFLENNRDKPFSILVQSNGMLTYAAQAILKNESVLINLPKERFPTGIAQAVLFTAEGIPVSERLVFVETLKPLDIKIQSDQSSYRPKGAVTLQLSVHNNDTTFTGDYSVSVVDEGKVPVDEDSETTILSNLLLTSDLKGYIERPNYYFNQANANRLEALDALLLTQGYKRFAYSDLIAGNYPPVTFFPEQGIEISGTLRLNNGRPVPNGGLLLSIPDRSFRTDVYTDAEGRFSFPGLVFTDSSRVTINARGNDNYRNMVIHVDQTTFPTVDANTHWADGVMNIDLVMKPYLDNSRRVFRKDIVLDEVEVVAANAPSRSHRDYPALSGLSMADHQIGPERLKGCNNLLQCLQTVLTGITYDNQRQLFYITRDYNAGGRIPVQFFVNGMAIDAFTLSSIAPGEVEGIDIFLKDELGLVSRTYQNNGVVSIYTKEPVEKSGTRMSLADIERLLPKANVVDLTPLGYMKEYTFYTPKYETEDSRIVNDFRSTVYWNPTVKTDEEGKASVHFYNADGKGTYRVTVEGFDATGNIGRAVYRYQVN